MFVADFFRRGETTPYHSWAPFAADSEAAANQQANNAVLLAPPGSTLHQAASFTVRRADTEPPIDQGR